MISKKTGEKLGFGALCHQMRKFLVSVMGEEELNALRPTKSSDRRRDSLALTDALQSILLRGESLPLRDFIDVRSLIVEARPDRAMLSVVSLDQIRKVCCASRRIRTFFERQDNRLLFKLTRPIEILSELEERIECTVDSNGKIYESASAELREIRKTLTLHREKLRAKFFELLSQAIQQGYAAEPRLTMRAGRMVIPLRSEAKRKMKGFIHDSSATGQTVYLEPTACLDLGNEVRILEAKEQREIERLLRELTKLVRHWSDQIEVNLSILGKIDLLHAKAQLSRKMGGVVPKLSEKPLIHIREGKKPCLTSGTSVQGSHSP